MAAERAARLGLLVALALGLAAASALSAEEARPKDANTAPCRKEGAVIASKGAGHLDDAGPLEATLSFRLKTAGRVWAEADGLSGLDREDHDSAPEAFLDDTYLGPLLEEHGGAWRSPEAVPLDAGDHQLMIRRAEVEGGRPRFAWTSWRVLGEAPCGQPPPRPSAAAGPCGALRRSGRWPARLKGRDLILSASGDAPAASGPLIHLKDGDEWRARMRIPLGADNKPLPLRCGYRGEDAQRLVFWVERDQAAGPVDATGYTPGAWEPLTVSLCGGKLVIRFAQSPEFDAEWKQAAADLEIEAQGLELGVRRWK